MSDRSTITRRHMLQGAAVASVAGLGALAPTSVLAKSDESSADAIVGAWRSVQTITGLPPFGSLTSFASAGTLVTSASIDLTTQFASTPGYGAWTRIGDGQYRAKFEFFTFDSSRNPSGSGLVRLKISVDGDRQRGPVTLTLFDLAGSVLVTTSGTFDATRIEAD